LGLNKKQPNQLNEMANGKKKKSDKEYKIITMRMETSDLAELQDLVAASGLSMNHILNGFMKAGIDLVRNSDRDDDPKFVRMLRLSTEDE